MEDWQRGLLYQFAKLTDRKVPQVQILYLPPIKGKTMKKKMNKWSLKKPLYLKKDDDRYDAHVKQLKKDGFSDAETWSLFLVMAEFILPRLKRFREINQAYPANMTSDEWDIILDKMIYSFEWTLENDAMSEDYMNLSEEEKKENWEKHKEGMGLFSEYFNDLWW